MEVKHDNQFLRSFIEKNKQDIHSHLLMISILLMNKGFNHFKELIKYTFFFLK